MFSNHVNVIPMKFISHVIVWLIGWLVQIHIQRQQVGSVLFNSSLCQTEVLLKLADWSLSAVSNSLSVFSICCRGMVIKSDWRGSKNLLLLTFTNCSSSNINTSSGTTIENWIFLAWEKYSAFTQMFPFFSLSHLSICLSLSLGSSMHRLWPSRKLQLSTQLLYNNSSSTNSRSAWFYSNTRHWS